MTFPAVRLQRYRQTPQIRKILAETFLDVRHLIMPLFIREGIVDKKPIPQLPNIFQQSIQTLLPEVERLANLGISTLLLFGIPLEKLPYPIGAFSKIGIIQQAIRLIKQEFPKMIVIADCCLCEYSADGHCGLYSNGQWMNDQTLELLKKIALSYAEEGVDIIAPSGMMDGMVRAIRQGLDEQGHTMVSIMSYAIKFASNFYGPFREAAGSVDVFKGDRRHHQVAYTQKKESIREALLDIEEGADYLMVKPGLPYLDILSELRSKTLLPLAAYQVSGEYAMIKAAAAAGILDEAAAFEETLIALRRAGADFIITYYADVYSQNIQ